MSSYVEDQEHRIVVGHGWDRRCAGGRAVQVNRSNAVPRFPGTAGRPEGAALAEPDGPFPSSAWEQSREASLTRLTGGRVVTPIRTPERQGGPDA